jgi:hypothetical protein
MLRKMINKLPDTATRTPQLADCVRWQAVQGFTPCVTGLTLTAWFVVTYAGPLRCPETNRIRWSDVKCAGDAIKGVTPTYMEITINNDVEVCKTHTCKTSFRCKAAGHGELCAVKAM